VLERVPVSVAVVDAVCVAADVTELVPDTEGANVDDGVGAIAHSCTLSTSSALLSALSRRLRTRNCSVCAPADGSVCDFCSQPVLP